MVDKLYVYGGLSLSPWLYFTQVEDGMPQRLNEHISDSRGVVLVLRMRVPAYTLPAHSFEVTEDGHYDRVDRVQTVSTAEDDQLHTMYDLNLTAGLYSRGPIQKDKDPTRKRTLHSPNMPLSNIGGQAKDIKKAPELG